MWDSDFEDFHVPDRIVQATPGVQRETAAASELTEVIKELRFQLMALETPVEATDARVRAVALVHSSLRHDNDAFYTSPAWRACSQLEMTVPGGSFTEVLAHARACKDSLESPAAT